MYIRSFFFTAEAKYECVMGMYNDATAYIYDGGVLPPKQHIRETRRKNCIHASYIGVWVDFFKLYILLSNVYPFRNHC